MSNPRDDDEDEFPMNSEPTPSQARRNRMRWERDFLRAKKIVYVIRNDVKELKLIYSQSVNFEF